MNPTLLAIAQGYGITQLRGKIFQRTFNSFAMQQQSFTWFSGSRNVMIKVIHFLSRNLRTWKDSLWRLGRVNHVGPIKG